MRDRARQIVLFLAIVGGTAGSCQGGFSVYTGADVGAGPTSPRPMSNAAAASFSSAAAALGPLSTITFESAPLGSFSSLAVAPGVTMTGASEDGSQQTILNSPTNPVNPNRDGFNTTPGGSQFVQVSGGTLTFTFANPIQFFGTYLTGVQTSFFADKIAFNDGTSETIMVPGTGTTDFNGEIAFVGFTDVGKSISSVTINAGSSSAFDDIGVDDVSYQVVPEPSSLILCGIACLGGLAFHVRRRSSS